MSNVLMLSRNDRTVAGVFGELVFPDGWSCKTVEREWLDNQTKVSCIPDGVYTLGLRYSPVVQRITRGRYKEGWEVEDVVGRSYIMIHPANWPTDLQGCIGVGSKIAMLQAKDGKLHKGVTNSQATFDKVMDRLNERSEWVLDIYTTVVEYP